MKKGRQGKRKTNPDEALLAAMLVDDLHWSAPEAADELHVSERTIRRWLPKGRARRRAIRRGHDVPRLNAGLDGSLVIGSAFAARLAAEWKLKVYEWAVSGMPEDWDQSPSGLEAWVRNLKSMPRKAVGP